MAPSTATDTTSTTTRRTFLGSVSTGWALFTLVNVAWIAALARFFFPNDLFEPPTKFKIGPPEDFATGVDERFKESHRIWVVRDVGLPPGTSEKVVIINATCTHLGCTPNWLSTENKFKCPCHGSGFYRNAINFEGPAPRPLERFKISLAADGQLEVDKGRKFQYELGQWVDPDSFYELG